MALAKHTTIVLVGALIAAWVGPVSAQEAAAEPLPVPERIQVQDQTSLWSMKRELQAHKAAVAASTLDELHTLAQIERARRGEHPSASPATAVTPTVPRHTPTTPRAVLADYHLHWIGMSRRTGVMTAVLSKADHYADVVVGDVFVGLAVKKVTAHAVTVSLHGQRTELRL